MENKNLNDIVIEDADNSKKTQLKNILTLLALLFIILIISIVITRLILGSDEENSDNTMITATETNKSDNGLLSTAATVGAAGAAAGAATVALNNRNNARQETTTTAHDTPLKKKVPLLTERNSSSHTKPPLRDHQVQTNDTKKETTSHTAHSTPKTVSTYTRPKYVINKTPVKSHTKTPSTTRTPSSHRSSSSSRGVTRGYYIKVGAFKDASVAIKNIKAIKLNYKTIKIKDGLTRVLIGPFYSHTDAKNHLAKAKAHVAKDAYITKIK